MSAFFFNFVSTNNHDMQIPDIIIAVDGYSSTGKSTFAKLISKEYGFTYLDSGALYRAVTLFAQESGLIDENNVISPDLEPAIQSLDLHFGPCGTYIGERCVEKEIRSMTVSGQVSPVSALPWVRSFVDDKLHAFAASGRVVMDGRDIGTAVFPDAQLKIFMVASDQVRAQRRLDELTEKGEQHTFEEILDNLRQRDYTDSHRETHPLCKAEDAFELDNSEMGFNEEMAWIKGLLQGRFGILC